MNCQNRVSIGELEEEGEGDDLAMAQS